MNLSSPFVRSFVLGAVWYAAVASKIMSRRAWTIEMSQVLILCIAWIITALIVGVLARNIKAFHSWLAVGVTTVVGSFVVMGLMLLTAPAR